MPVVDTDSAEGKALIQAAVDEAVTGLKNKQAELLAKLKRAEKGAEIDPAEFQATRDELEQAKDRLAESAKLVKIAQADAEKFRKAAETESSYTCRLLVENGLNDALGKAGVKPEYLKAAKALIAGQVSLKTEGETRTPVVGDKGLADYVGEWAKSDEGKHFIAAPVNSGGGAHGGSPGGGKTITRREYDANPAAFAAQLAARQVSITD